VPKVFIISTGTELLLGTTHDSNSEYLAQQLEDIGLRVAGKVTVGDSREQIQMAFAAGLETADIIVSTGGLGPTFDDLTKTVACELMGCSLVVRPEEEQRLRDFFAQRRRPMPEINMKQAMFPVEAEVLSNTQGTAPGMYLRRQNKLLILLPGPPREMTRMYLSEVKPRLERDYADQLQKVLRRTIKVIGPGESQVEEMLADMLNNSSGYSAALLAQEGEIHIKLAIAGGQSTDSIPRLNELTKLVQHKMHKHIFGYDDETLPEQTGKLLAARGRKLAVAESCTAGMLGSMITEVSGSSDYFWGGVITYSNDSKMKLLNVQASTLEQYGAVSQQTAEEMARGIRQLSGVDYGLAITGIAGPCGGTREKPVGLVYVALAGAQTCRVRELKLGGSREIVRRLSAKSALDLLRRHID